MTALSWNLDAKSTIVYTIAFLSSENQTQHPIARNHFKFNDRAPKAELSITLVLNQANPKWKTKLCGQKFFANTQSPTKCTT